LEIKPLVPTWPSRPARKVKKETGEADLEHKDEEKDPNKKDEDASPHIDEYA
jgi:hypothetical protein